METTTDPNASTAATRYRAICPLAIASVVVGCLSVFLMLTWYLAFVPLFGVWLGRKALKQIRLAPSEWTGEGLAKTGIGISAGLLVFGCAWLLWVGGREIPHGYTLVSYEQLQPDPNMPADPIPQTALDMQDKKVFIRGFIQARRQQTGIKEFILCPSNGDCQFCTSNPKRTEMVRVVLQGDMTTNYTTRQIGVGGRLQVDPADPGGIPYTIEADCLR